MNAKAEESTYEFKRIVAATDFSDTAAVGVDLAVQIARDHGAHLTLVHAVQLPSPRPDYDSAGSDFGTELQAAAREQLTVVAGEVDADGLELHTRLLVGQASRAILEVAHELQADLIVLGTRGLSGLRHLFLGSTAERVVQHAECPVLTTHGEGGEGPRRIRTILVPTDFDDNAREAVVAARELLRPEEAARLVLLHAYHLPIEYTAYGTAPISPAFLEESRIRAEADLKELADSLDLEGVGVETQATAGYAVETILSAAEAHEVDLIAMGTSGRTGAAHLFLGSTAERVVQRAGCPVLTLRRPGEEK